MKISFRIAGITALILITAACATTGTKITGSWTRLDHEPANFNRIVVLGIAPNSTNRRIFEDHVQTKLAEAGYPVTAALDLLPPTAAVGTISKEIVMEIFKSVEADAVFTMSVRHMEDTRRYVPGSSVYVPYYYNVPFYDYYSGFSNYYYTPGYYTGSLQIFLEANLFDFNTGELIWSAQSKTTDMTSIDKMAAEYAEIIVADFIRQQVVALPEGK